MPAETTVEMPPRRPFRSRATIPLLLVGAAGVLLVLYAWRLPPFQSTVQRTEDAYVRGNVTLISPKLDGYVAEVLVQDFAEVKAGQPLVRLDDRIYRQRLLQAEAALSSQEANLANSEQQRRQAEANVGAQAAQIDSARTTLERNATDLRRYETLFARGFVSGQQVDQSRAAVAQARAAVAQTTAAREAARQGVTSAIVGRGSLAAAVESAQAAIRLAQIDLENTSIAAPRAGRLGEVGVRLGQYVTPGAQLMALVPDQVWVVANFKETQLARIAVGQRASVKVDALGGARLSAHVERISPAAGSEFSVLRPENASGNFTKVVQRIPVRLSLDPGQPLSARLSPGMSVLATVETGR